MAYPQILAKTSPTSQTNMITGKLTVHIFVCVWREGRWALQKFELSPLPSARTWFWFVPSSISSKSNGRLFLHLLLGGLRGCRIYFSYVIALHTKYRKFPSSGWLCYYTCFFFLPGTTTKTTSLASYFFQGDFTHWQDKSGISIHQPTKSAKKNPVNVSSSYRK